MTRLILVTGPGGVGATTLARATVDALRSEGASADLVVPAAAARMRATESVAGALGGVLGALGADALPVEAWAGLPGLSPLGLLFEAHERLQEVDAVVIDAGPLSAARELVELPSSLVRLLDAALTPSLAMWRSIAGEDAAFQGLSEAREQVAGLERMLQAAGTTMRVVVPPDDAGVAVAHQAVSLFAVLGVGVDGLVLNRFPRRKDDVGKGDWKRAKRALADLRASVDGVEAWTSPASRVRAVPKGRSAMGPFAEVHRLTADDLTVDATDESFTLDLPLPATAVARARVGVTDDRLVVEFDGSYRWLELPPVLRRCAPVSGVRGLGGIRFEFRPNPDVWMGGGAT